MDSHDIAWVKRIVEGSVKELRPDGRFDIEDLIQEGYIAYLHAQKNHDPGKCASIRTFAVPRIRGAVADYVRRVWKSRRAGYDQCKEISLDRIMEASGDKIDIGGVTAGDMGLSVVEDETREFQNAAMRYALTDQMRVVLYLTKHDWTLKKIGEYLGFSEGRACQVLTSAVNAVQKCTRDTRNRPHILRFVKTEREKMNEMDRYIASLKPDEKLEFIRRMTAVETERLCRRRDELRLELARVEGMIEIISAAPDSPKKVEEIQKENRTGYRAPVLLLLGQHPEGMRTAEIWDMIPKEQGMSKGNLSAWLYHHANRGLLRNDGGKFSLPDSIDESGKGVRE